MSLVTEQGTVIGGCTKDCTVDCGRCKGDPLGMIQRHIMRGLGWSRGAHGGVPFDKKDAWDDGYREAIRAVRRVLYPEPANGSEVSPS